MYRLIGRGFPSACFCTFSNQIFGTSSKIGGSSSDSLYSRYAGKFYNEDLEEYKKKVYKSKVKLPGVNIVTTPQECKQCVDILMKEENIVAAWDTETMDLDIKQEAPVGKGSIICATFFAGPQFNFGRGPRVFIDNFGQNAGLLNYFKGYLESEKHKKVWHNYGFDRHLFNNHGIDVRGFGGDTMHMARLQDASKLFGKYSLAQLTKEFEQSINKWTNGVLPLKIKQISKQSKSAKANGRLQEAKEIDAQLQCLEKYLTVYVKQRIPKKKMELIFGRKRILKSGGEGLTYQYPNTLTLHTNKEYIENWIKYAVLDAESTFLLRQVLEIKLKIDVYSKESKSPLQNRWQFYQKYWLPLGQVLTGIEREGIQIDIEHIERIETQAREDLKQRQNKFMQFLKSFQNGRNIDHFNVSSTLQLQQLLFAPCDIKQGVSPKQKKENEKKNNVSKQVKELNNSMQQSLQQEKQQKKHEGKAYEVKKTERKAVTLNELVKVFKVENKYSTKPKYVQMDVMGLGIPLNQNSKLTPTGLPAVDISVLQELAGEPDKGKFGKAYEYDKKDPQFGQNLCKALKTLVDYSMNETLLNTFIEPLKSYADQNRRVHCSLNINTQTGRLSARKPNLQNQPALDKDVYKIRKAFVAGKGKKFIVADYGQLQLRVLAHLTDCKAMLKAFKEGGDFHSRTAIDMYDYIAKDMQKGNILLQWDKSKGDPPVPLLKEKYAAERKKAKTVNFSIAYGKTATGFSNDWGCSLSQAKQIITAWFRQRKEVEVWQKGKKQTAKQKGYSETLLGRKRKLGQFFNSTRQLEGMGNRRAINTPVQGGAADIVNASMVKIARDPQLKRLGWKLLMQIHDELIVQGPQQSAEEALKIVVDRMQNPFEFKLLVDLQVDAKIGDNWYDCK